MSRKLFVGNLPYSVTSERLQEAFSQFGTVASSKVIVDRETGRSRGFAPGTMIAAVLWPARNVGDFRKDLAVAGQSGNAALACVEAAWRIDRLFEIGHCGTPRSISGPKRNDNLGQNRRNF